MGVLANALSNCAYPFISMGLHHDCYPTLFVNLINDSQTLNKKYRIEKVKAISHFTFYFYECIYYHVRGFCMPTFMERVLELDD